LFQKSWEQNLAGLNMAIKLRNGHLNISDLAGEGIINRHAYFVPLADWLPPAEIQEVKEQVYKSLLPEDVDRVRRLSRGPEKQKDLWIYMNSITPGHEGLGAMYSKEDFMKREIPDAARDRIHNLIMLRIDDLPRRPTVAEIRNILARPEFRGLFSRSRWRWIRGFFRRSELEAVGDMRRLLQLSV
jgi:hypothetical protein